MGVAHGASAGRCFQAGGVGEAAWEQRVRGVAAQVVWFRVEPGGIGPEGEGRVWDKG